MFFCNIFFFPGDYCYKQLEIIGSADFLIIMSNCTSCDIIYCQLWYFLFLIKSAKLANSGCFVFFLNFIASWTTSSFPLLLKVFQTLRLLQIQCSFQYTCFRSNVLFLTSDNEFSGIIYSLFKGRQNIFQTIFSNKFVIQCATRSWKIGWQKQKLCPQIFLNREFSIEK